MSDISIKLKKSSVGGKRPLAEDLQYGELAINYNDGRLFYRNSSNIIKNFIDSDLVNSVIDTKLALAGIGDSSQILTLINSSSVDSDEVIQLIDSDYIQSRQLVLSSTDQLEEGTINLYYTKSRVDSDISTTVTKTYIESLGIEAGVDSAAITNLVDSDYVNERVSGVFDNTGAITLPVGTTAQRPSPASAGMFRFNSELLAFEGYNGTEWVSFTTPADETPLEGDLMTQSGTEDLQTGSGTVDLMESDSDSLEGDLSSQSGTEDLQTGSGTVDLMGTDSGGLEGDLTGQSGTEDLQTGSGTVDLLT